MRCHALILAALAPVAFGCARPTYNPFVVPRHEIYGQVKTIALRSVWLPSDLPDRDRIAAQIDSLISAELIGAGFTVVPSRVADSIWSAKLDSAGGAYNARTGERDSVRVDLTRRATLQELARHHGADALLHPTIFPELARFVGGVAKWRGTTQRLQPNSKTVLAVLTGSVKSGEIGALTLAIVIEDTTTRDLYKDFGGLEVTTRLTSRGFDSIPLDRLFQDPARTQNAVRLALGALTRRGQQARASR